MSKKTKPSEVKVTAPGNADPPQQVLELWGYGVEQSKGGWVAYRVSNLGALEFLTPDRAGKPRGEQRHYALARMLAAVGVDYHPRKVRG